MNWKAFLGYLGAVAGLLLIAIVLVYVSTTFGVWSFIGAYIAVVILAGVVIGVFTKRDYPRYRRRGRDDEG